MGTDWILVLVGDEDMDEEEMEEEVESKVPGGVVSVDWGACNGTPETMAELVSAVQLWICQRATDRFRRLGTHPAPHLASWWKHLIWVVKRAAASGGETSLVTAIKNSANSQTWLGLPRSEEKDTDYESGTRGRRKRKAIDTKQPSSKKQQEDPSLQHGDWETNAMLVLSQWHETFVRRKEAYFVDSFRKDQVPVSLLTEIAEGVHPHPISAEHEIMCSIGQFFDWTDLTLPKIDDPLDTLPKSVQQIPHIRGLLVGLNIGWRPSDWTPEQTARLHGFAEFYRPQIVECTFHWNLNNWFKLLHTAVELKAGVRVT